MGSFVNRKEELTIVNEAMNTLLNKERLLRTPIVEFHGIEGIGKTTLLTQVKDQCSSQKLFYVWADIKEQPSHHFLQSAKTYLAERHPVVIIIDSLDSASADLLKEIESSLSDLVQSSNNVFVVMASRNIQKFDNARSIARKLTIRSLSPLKREFCLSYLKDFDDAISSDTRDTIFEWTRGYPLAMITMANAIINEHLDITKEQSQKHLVRVLKKEVIEKNLLKAVTSYEERVRFQTLLALLSLPRRFNLILMQDLIERFAPQYQQESSLAYITLPNEINTMTSVLEWNLERGGYCITVPVRNLFLTQYRIEQPQRSIEIHRFLAEENENFALEVGGSDRSRYLREFFYHLALSESVSRVQEKLTEHIDRLAQTSFHNESEALRHLESFLQFYEEIQLDDELKEALGNQNASFALSMVYRNFLAINRQLPESVRGNWLKRFFSLVTSQQESRDFALSFEEGMRLITKQVARNHAITLYDELIQDAEVRTLLGARFHAVTAHIVEELLTEESK